MGNERLDFKNLSPSLLAYYLDLVDRRSFFVKLLAITRNPKYEQEYFELDHMIRDFSSLVEEILADPVSDPF